MHRTYLGGIERGERNPSYANLLRLARALEVSGSQLLAEAERADG
jgi:transcriptional regulator with XRE-family HTH domain